MLEVETTLSRGDCPVSPPHIHTHTHTVLSHCFQEGEHRWHPFLPGSTAVGLCRPHRCSPHPHWEPLPHLQHNGTWTGSFPASQRRGSLKGKAFPPHAGVSPGVGGRGVRGGGGSVPGCHSPELGSATCPAQPSHRSPSPWPCLGKQQPPGEPRGRVYRCCPHGLLIPNRPLCCEIQTHRAVVTVLGFQRPPAHLPEMGGGG